MRPSLLLPICATALLVSGCVGGSHGPRADMATLHTLSGFDAVDASAGVRVILSQGPFSVKADEASGNFERLILHVRGDTLIASRNTDWFSWGNDAPDYTITVSAPSWREFDVSSGAHVDGSGLSMRDVKIDVSSGARIELAGGCTGIEVDASSGGHFDGEQLRCEAAHVDVSSGGHVDAFATRSAEGNASSGGNVTFHGKPASFSEDSSSGGSVRLN